MKERGIKISNCGIKASLFIGALEIIMDLNKSILLEIEISG
jgi:hypothetical protein